MRNYFIVVLFGICLLMQKGEADECTSAYERKTVCLNMIVKNESKVIKRCLASVLPYIDYWVIVDTGSTDGTQDIIREFMKDVPGELYERPWVNFAHNRNEALECAKGKADYLLIIDADETLEATSTFVMPKLDKDFYYITTKFNGTQYGRVQLINAHKSWKWDGVLHEALIIFDAKTSDTLQGLANVVYTDGFRSTDPKKFYKDAQILEAALEKEPNNTRYQFYLAQSYRDAGESELALKHYKKRVSMGGWDQELFWSLLQIARLQETLKMAPETIIDGYNKAIAYRPTRAEPLFFLTNYYRRNDNFAAGYDTALKGLCLPFSDDVLFVDTWIYDYDLLLEFSICAYWTGRYVEAQLASKLLIADLKLPANVRECAQKNLYWCDLKITETIQQKESARV